MPVELENNLFEKMTEKQMENFYNSVSDILYSGFFML